ncbi:hypothetical protein HYU95_00975 [Candidatus Daviesbacteria bacterium]|nr:hypothetical protein [Candidatus Daviesbacteria bacterium]
MKMSKLKINTKIKRIFEESIFGALFTLWTAPIDEPKMDVSKVSRKNNGWFVDNLIIGHKS